MNTRARMMLLLLTAPGLLIFCGVDSANAIEVVADIVVEAGEHDYVETPVWTALPDAIENMAAPLKLEETTGGKRRQVAAQIERGNGAWLSWILTGKTPAGSKRTFELVVGMPALRAEDAMRVAKNDKTLKVAHGKQEVLQYRHAVDPPPAGRNALFARSAFIHPLKTPSGYTVTDVRPADHLHHMGLWHPWKHGKTGDRKVNYWEMQQGDGTVRFNKLLGQSTGQVFARFAAQQDYVDRKAPDGEKVQLHEFIDVRAWRPTGKDPRGYVLDYVILGRSATDQPFTVTKYRYSGFSFRGTADWHNETSEYLTSAGKTRANANATRARWCRIEGKAAAGKAGVLIMSHPENFNHPEPIRIWSANIHRGMIFYNYNPVQDRDWKFEPNTDYARRYRLFVYDGALTEKEAERLWQDYAHPPKITVEKL